MQRPTTPSKGSLLVTSVTSDCINVTLCSPAPLREPWPWLFFRCTLGRSNYTVRKRAGFRKLSEIGRGVSLVSQHLAESSPGSQLNLQSLNRPRCSLLYTHRNIAPDTLSMAGKP